jgi:hypothetical protein
MRPIDDYEERHLAEMAGEGCPNYPDGDPWGRRTVRTRDRKPSPSLRMIAPTRTRTTTPPLEGPNGSKEW